MTNDIFSLVQDAELPALEQAAYTVLSLFGKGRYYLMFFTLVPAKFASHYDDVKKAHYLCPGAGCPACAVGLRVTEHVYLPAWDAQSRRVVVVKMAAAGDALRELVSVLKLYRDKLADVVAVVDCLGDGKVRVTAHDPLPETDRGATACAAFAAGLEADTVDLRDCVRRLAPEQIAALPAVKQRGAKLVGGVVPPATPEG